VLAELNRVLARPHIRRRLKWDDARVVEFSDRLREQSVIVTTSERVDAVRDPDDNRVLEAAVAGEAEYIVTGDRDLLDLGSCEGIRIVTPAAFVELLPG
jgi:putative PIN family toxin of toxin-antitoxin system